MTACSTATDIALTVLIDVVLAGIAGLALAGISIGAAETYFYFRRRFR